MTSLVKEKTLETKSIDTIQDELRHSFDFKHFEADDSNEDVNETSFDSKKITNASSSNELKSQTGEYLDN